MNLFRAFGSAAGIFLMVALYVMLARYWPKNSLRPLWLAFVITSTLYFFVALFLARG